MTDELRFAKYQGTGNDFVMLVDLDDERPLEPDAVAALCHRRTGVGADGVIRLVRSSRPDASFVMDYRNADGSLAEMCGNGARCVGKLVHDLGLAEELEFGMQTLGGIRRLRLHEDGGEVRRVTVSMGVPGFTKAAIPMRGPAWETFLGQPFDVGGGMTLTASAVSMGNPHLVLFVDDDPDRVPRLAHRSGARASRAVPRAHQRGVRTGPRRRDQGARVGARLRRDPRVRQRGVRGRGGGERGRAGPGRPRSSGSPEVPSRSNARRAERSSSRGTSSASSRARWTSTACGAVSTRERAGERGRRRAR